MAIDEKDVTKVRSVFRKIPYFVNMTFGELDIILDNLNKHIYKKGTEIIIEGEKGFTLYFIYSGHVSVWEDTEEKTGFFKKKPVRNKISELHEGEIFGETALFKDDPRDATVIAEAKSTIFELNKREFDEILMKNPSIKEGIKKVMER